MANALYDKGREAFLSGSISWSADTIKAVLVDAGTYTRNLATDQFLSDIPIGARVATSGALTTKTVTAGVADADDVIFATVSGASAEYVVLYKDTTVATTSPLIACIDTATGLPVTPGGGNITVTWDNGSNRVFKL